jgi:hypothetical protein
MVTGPTGSSLSVWFSVRSFVRSFVRLFVRVPERSIWSSEFVSHTNLNHTKLKALYIHFAQCDLCAIPLEMPSMF